MECRKLKGGYSQKEVGRILLCNGIRSASLNSVEQGDCTIVRV